MKLKKEAILLTLTVHDKLAATTVDSHFVSLNVTPARGFLMKATPVHMPW